MKDSYILGFRATVEYPPKSIKKIHAVKRLQQNVRQTLYFVVKFEKLSKLK